MRNLSSKHGVAQTIRTENPCPSLRNFQEQFELTASTHRAHAITDKRLPKHPPSNPDFKKEIVL